MSRENCTRTLVSVVTSTSSVSGAVKITVGAGSLITGIGVGSGTVSVGGFAMRSDSPSIHTRLPSTCTVPDTSSQRPVSTLAPGSSSKPVPLGRRPLTQIAASADCTTKSHRDRFNADGRSPKRLRPLNRPVTVTPRSANFEGWSTMARTRGGGRLRRVDHRRANDDEDLVAIRPAAASHGFQQRAEVVAGKPRVVFAQPAEVEELPADFAVAP